MKKASKADVFDVWGKPPPLLRTLTERQERALKRYIEGIAKKVYRIAYDCGAVEGFCKVNMIATAELKAQRERMAKSRQ